jgi:hypothetical protein
VVLGGGVRNHLEVTSVPPNTTFRPPPPLKFEKHGGSRIFYVRGFVLFGDVCVKLQVLMCVFIIVLFFFLFFFYLFFLFVFFLYDIFIICFYLICFLICFF